MAKMLSERLHLKWYSMGEIQAKMAQESGLTIDEHLKRAAEDPSWDRKVDAFQKKLGEDEDNFISDGLLGWHFIPHAFKIFLTVDPETAANRIFNDRKGDGRNDEPEYRSVEEAGKIIRERVEINRRRYLDIYGADFLDLKNYDLIIDTTQLTPNEVFGQIQTMIRSKTDPPCKPLFMSIDKLGWIFIKDRKMLNVRSKGAILFYTPGGQREGNETDQEAILRELKEELDIDLKVGTIEYLETFEAQADAKPPGTMVRIKCYKSDFEGEFTPSNEIEELGWQTSRDIDQLSATGQLIVHWLKDKNLID